ncbi:T-lymphocyte activation antigen CD80 isoform X2 [Rhinatrema bivittatum]|uniref:T-lymphocyte activation antigen CD80 isoform X2 n=1 Tax=Rhinatrema bivittatum TaxID=194408 RepID=UPI0011292612|nr:T-lymphocyte activation antigen CD80 isoform X2 [Rhinatrema bivittatum]
MGFRSDIEEMMSTQEIAFMPPKNLSTKDLQLWFFMFLFLFSSSGDGKTVNVQSKVGKEVELPCSYNLLSVDSLKTHRVYWQKGLKVAAAYLNGGEDKTHQHPDYLNRTTLRISNLSLVFSHTRAPDEGLYDCMVFQLDQMKSSELKHESRVLLSLVADFSKPVISESRVAASNGIPLVNLTCSSRGGYPEPRIFWNSWKEIPSSTESLLQDPRTGLYNVSSTLSLTVTEDLNLTCSVAYTGLQTSSDYQFISGLDEPRTRAPPTQSSADGRPQEVLLATSVILACVFLMGWIMLKKHSLCCDQVCRIRLPQRSQAVPVAEEAEGAITVTMSEAPA